MSGPLLALHQVLASEQAGGAAAAPAIDFGVRSMEQLRLDDSSIAAARHVFVNLAMDRAQAQYRAAPALDELQLLQLQQMALREAADMVAARIRSGVATRRGAAPVQ